MRVADQLADHLLVLLFKQSSIDFEHLLLKGLGVCLGTGLLHCQECVNYYNVDSPADCQLGLNILGSDFFFQELLIDG